MGDGALDERQRVPGDRPRRAAPASAAVAYLDREAAVAAGGYACPQCRRLARLADDSRQPADAVLRLGRRGRCIAVALVGVDPDHAAVVVVRDEAKRVVAARDTHEP